MKPEDKRDILGILENWKQLVGVDKVRTQQLINVINPIRPEEPKDPDLINQIEGYYKEVSELMGYNPETDNQSRGDKKPIDRYVMYHLATSIYGISKNMNIASQQFFGKHRTAILHWDGVIKNMIDTKDKEFYHKLSQFLNTTIDR